MLICFYAAWDCSRSINTIYNFGAVALQGLQEQE